MSASSNKKTGWMEELKKSASKKNIFENIEKERFLSNTSPIERHQDIPEIVDFDHEETIETTPDKSAFKKELNVDILKNSNVNLDTIDLTVLMDVLEAETEIDDEKDEVWTWNALFTRISAQIADEK
jgi:hypothetical protein